jgi:hypothetical protein
MGSTLRIILLLFVGSLLGFVTAQRTIDAGGRAVAGGQWRSWNAPSGDPYSLAHYLREGVLPPDSPQWTVYEAELDSSGAGLDGDCVYSLKGRLPQARWWRLVADAGSAADPLAHRSWLESDAAVFEADGSIAIAVAPEPRAANWIEPSGRSAMTLQFFFLEERKGSGQLPPIDRISCP